MINGINGIRERRDSGGGATGGSGISTIRPPPLPATPALPPRPPSPPIPPARIHQQARFTVETRKQPISSAGPMDALSRRVGIPIPEMVFGDNLVSILHRPTGWRIDFRTEDALDAVGKTGENMLQVAHAREWSSSRGDVVREVVRPYDWSYSTTYRGTVSAGRAWGRERGRGRERREEQNGEDVAAAVGEQGGGKQPEEGEQEEEQERGGGQGEGEEEQGEEGSIGTHHDDHNSRPVPAFRPVTTPIPLDLLRRRDPILFFDDVLLYESELDDNGISVLSVKVRVHAQRMLLLCRLFMRLDGVAVRVRDTRLYVDFETDQVLREYTAREDGFENVKRALVMSGRLPDDVTAALRDPNVLVPMLPAVEESLEGVCLSS